MVNVSTITGVFSKMLEHDLQAAALYRAQGAWHKLSAKELYRRTMNTARALEQWGIRPGDRTAIISENRYEWAVADFATLILGAVDVPVYPTLIAEQMAYILKDSGVRIAFVSTQEQLRKVRSVQSQTDVEKIVLMDDAADSGAESMSAIMQSLPYAPHPDLDARLQATRPDDLATIIYTSGTTGTPKGVMLTHGNIASNIVGATTHFVWSNGEGYVSFLPLSHITARHVDYCMYGQGIGISYCPSFEDIPQVLREVRPSNFVSVPRVYEKIRQEAERRAGNGLRKMIFDWALRVGKKYREETVAGRIPLGLDWTLAHRLVFSKVRDSLGGRANCFISGGAPLGIQTANWFADIGIRIFEGYGLTETSPVIAVNNAHAVRLGSVGPPLPNVECRIAEDGELLVRGPSVTQGYWNLPQETAAAFSNGWFHTGDIGYIDADGFLFITDRKKDLLKTSGGKFIAPQPIENLLKSNVLVAHAAVIGDKRKYPAVLIAPQFPLLSDWAQANDVAFGSREDLIHHPKVRALYEGIVADMNTHLAHFERLKRVILVPDEFTVASEELTPSLKLKRRFVEKKYSALIEALYSEPAGKHHELAETHN